MKDQSTTVLASLQKTNYHFKMKKLMKYIKKILFGERAKGETLPSPTVKTMDCINRPTFDVWTKQVKFGSRYGHRGSFYNKK